MATMNIQRTEFSAALSQVASERGIDPSQVLESIKAAILTAYKKDYGEEEGFEYEVILDPVTGESHLFDWPVEEPKKRKEITPAGFGRIAAQQARNIIIQKIREAEKNAVLEEYERKIGSLVNGMILRFDGDNVVVDLGKGEGLMPFSEQNKEEQYKLNNKMTFYLEGIRETLKGRQLILSRKHEGLVLGLFKREVPEVSSGVVEIKLIAREAGSRTKIAVYSHQSGVDPVGSCVGQKGVRVQAVINEIGGEKIDIIQYSEDEKEFILASLSPADDLEVKIDKESKTALVYASEENLSLAIGKGGQNVRLASRLTGYKIDIESDSLEKVAEELKEEVKEEVSEEEVKKDASEEKPSKEEKKKIKKTKTKKVKE
jgi:N utilization substance protein A